MVPKKKKAKTWIPDKKFRAWRKEENLRRKTLHILPLSGGEGDFFATL